MSMAFVGTQLISFAGNQADLWIVGATVPAAQLSLFAAASRLITVISTPLIALQFTLTPTIASLYGAGQIARLQSLTRKAATVATIPALVSLAVIGVAPRPLMSVIFGAAFAGGASALLWLTIGQTVNSLTGVCGQVLTMTGHQRDALWIGVIAFAVKLAVGIPVARTVGITGYAAVTSTITAAMNVVYLLFVRWRIGIWTHPTLRVGGGSPI